MKLAVQVWRNRGEQRVKVVALEDAYHGDTFGAMAAGARSLFSAPFDEMLFSVERLSIRGDAADLERAEELFRSGEVACFIFEPLVQGAGGMRMYEARVLDQYCEIAKRYGVLCIADEVMTGFGRTGELFACNEMTHRPDLVCLSKGITSGTLPLAVTMCREDLFQEFVSPDHSRTFFHGHTFTANPIACAVALASLDILLSAESVAARDRIAASHTHFIQSLEGLAGVEAPRSRGTICAFDAISSAGKGYGSAVAQRAREFFSERGVLLRPLGNVVYCMPPYCYTDEELQRTYSAMYDFAVAMQEAG
jgi:adenosylmethionine-8-amino-7-oxononanoate aminotransferase